MNRKQARMTTNSITLDSLNRAVALMKELSVKPKIVESKKEARRMTKNDPTGHTWKVGEKYYLLHGTEGKQGLRYDN